MQERKGFDERYIRMETRRLCELTSAADALEMKPLVDLASRALARLIEGKTPEQVLSLDVCSAAANSFSHALIAGCCCVSCFMHKRLCALGLISVVHCIKVGICCHMVRVPPLTALASNPCFDAVYNTVEPKLTETLGREMCSCCSCNSQDSHGSVRESHTG